MYSSTCTVTTPNASKYLQQVCKHFAHKLPVTYDEAAGSVTFSIGTCDLRADTSTLHLDCRANTAEQLGQLQTVIEDHAKRFAWREELSFDWREAG